MISNFDVAGFRSINGFAGRDIILDTIGIFGARFLIGAMALLAVAYVIVAWKTSHFEGRFENLLHAFWAAVIGFVLEHLVGFFWFRPRPFVTLANVLKLIDKSPLEKSFPSGHATAAFAIAFALFIRNRRWGTLMLVLALLVGASRIYVGVHYPLDIVGGIVTGFIAAVLAAPVKKFIEPYLDLLPVFSKFKRQTK